MLAPPSLVFLEHHIFALNMKNRMQWMTVDIIHAKENDVMPVNKPIVQNFKKCKPHCIAPIAVAPSLLNNVIKTIYITLLQVEEQTVTVCVK